MTDVVDRADHFARVHYPENKKLYEKLTRGQKPKVMVIGCADSRIVPELMLGVEPGDVFVARNAGNIVPPFNAPTNGVAASVEFAIQKVGVEHVVVCGHFDCGAMKGVGAAAGALDSMPAVRDWVRYGAAARAAVDARGETLDADERLKAIALENVKVQLQNLRTYPSVAAGLAAGELQLHGWYADIEAGAILVLDDQTGEFSPA